MDLQQQLASALGEQVPGQQPTATTAGAAAQPQAQLASLYYQQLLGQQLQAQQLQTQQQTLLGVPGQQASPPQIPDSAAALQQLFGQQTSPVAAGLLGMQLQQAASQNPALGLGLQQQSALLHQQLLAAAAGGSQSLLRAGGAQSSNELALAGASSSAGSTQVFQGDIVDYDDVKGFGFIECADTQKIYGIDIFLLRSALDGAVVNPGDKVSFQVEKGPKGPKAANVSVIQKIDDREDLPTFYGTLKRFDERRGLGFLDCAETLELYGKDILVFKSQLGDSRNGAKLSFSIIKDARGVKAAKVKILEEFPPGVDPMKATPKLMQGAADGSLPLLSLQGGDAASSQESDWKPAAKFAARPNLIPQMPQRERSRSPKPAGSGPPAWTAGAGNPGGDWTDWKDWSLGQRASTWGKQW